jgi:hypothetical protein
MSKIEIFLAGLLVAYLIYHIVALIRLLLSWKSDKHNIQRTTIPVDETRWISEGMILTYRNGYRVRVTFVDHLNRIIEVEKY